MLERANRAWICSWAWRTVAVEATIFGRTRDVPLVWLSLDCTHSASMTVSYRPTIVPSGPDIRCSSSWITSSGPASGWRSGRPLLGPAAP